MTKIFALLIMLSCSFPSSMTHDFKLSICRIKADTEHQIWNINFYVFEDDLKEVIYHNPENDFLKNEDITNYLNQHFKLSLNDRITPFVFLNKKMKEDDLLEIKCRIEMPDSFFLKKINIMNDLMLEKFEKQTNMVHLKIGNDFKKSANMNNKKRQVSLDF